MSLPVARVVRQHGVEVAPPRPSLQQWLRGVEDGLGPRVRTTLAVVVGLWPVTAVVLLAGGLAWIASMQGAP